MALTMWVEICRLSKNEVALELAWLEGICRVMCYAHNWYACDRSRTHVIIIDIVISGQKKSILIA